MASGRVELVSTGVQDQYITDAPTFTYFHKQFRRHTRFATDTIINTFNGDVDFGKTMRCIINRKGDLVKSMSLKFVLPPLDGADDPAVGTGYTDSIAHALVEYVDLIIGGQVIERVTGETIEIYHEYHTSTSHQEALKQMAGKTGTRTGLGPASSTLTGEYGTYPRRVIATLPFYFYRNNSMAIPLCALGKQEIELAVKIRDLKDLVVSTVVDTPVDLTATTPTGLVPFNCEVAVEYAYITQTEIDFFKSRGVDYLITQTQMATVKFEAAEEQKRVRLNFTNPCRELWMVMQNNSNVVDYNDTFNYYNPEHVMFPKYHNLLNVGLQFNNEIRIDPEVADTHFLRYVQPMEHHTNVPDRNIYCYSFSIDPESSEPQGQVNMSRVINKDLTITGSASTQERTFRIYARVYNVLRIQHGLAGVIFNDVSHT
jgi:hypothetical protein